MMISSTGTLVRTPVAEISIVGRNTQGVRLIRLGEGERLTGVECIESLVDDSAVPEPRPDSIGGEEVTPTDPPAS
jgi:DNA gyrase subunit A